jgi:hypothetical protein
MKIANFECGPSHELNLAVANERNHIMDMLKNDF